MKKIAFLLPLVFASHAVFAQATLHDINGKAVKSFDNRYEGVKGTPYFMPDWGKASLEMANKTLFDNVDVKYNVIDNNLVYRNPKGEIMIIDSHQVNHFILKDTLGNVSYTFRKPAGLAGSDLKLSQQFCLMLHEGKGVQFALMPAKKLMKADFTGGYSSDKTTDEIITENTYYVIKGKNQAQKVKLNRKSLLAVVADRQDQVKAYIDKEKIDPSTDKGWVKALAYYETL